MNDNIEFRFITRTFSEDYKVFYENGSKQLLDIDEFAPLRKICNIIPEEGPCAVFFEKNEKIFLVVSGMKCGKNDKAGRPIRFSFCRIYQRNNQNYKERAWNAFVKIISEWNAAEYEISEERKPSLIEIIPVTRNSGFYGEDIKFDEKIFIDWLENSSSTIYDIKFTYCNSGKLSKNNFINSFIWPDNGYVVKWNKNNELIECLPAGDRVQHQNHYNMEINNNAGNKTLQDLIKAGLTIAAKEISAKGIDFLDGIKNSPQLPATMEQDRNNILEEIGKLYKKHSFSMTIEQQVALKKASELLAFALTQKR